MNKLATLIMMLTAVLSVYAQHEAHFILTDSVQRQVVIDREIDSVPVLDIHQVDTQLLEQEVPENPTKGWWKKLRAVNFNVADTTIRYPKFLQFCVDTYNWGDRFFNTYDPEYVLPTGKKWKFILKNENWNDAYAMHLTRNVPITMFSEINSNIGAYLCFMAVSVGYSWDIASLMGKPANHKRFDFSFTCARFTGALYYYQNNDGTTIKRLGDFNNGHRIDYHFPGLRHETFGLDVYYFLNNKKFSYGAAYCFSKYQVKSAGSVMLGFSYDNQDIRIDFASLPDDMKVYLRNPREQFRFKYYDYCISAGYSYNWVFHKHWVFNITGMPAIGIKHSPEPMSKHKDTLSMNIKTRGALVYNVRNFFFGLLGRFDGYWYLDSDYSFFNTIETISLQAGIRF